MSVLFQQSHLFISFMGIKTKWRKRLESGERRMEFSREIESMANCQAKG